MNEHYSDDEVEETGALDSAAVALHEVYQAFRRAGFSDEQAFHFVLAQWEASIQ